MKKLTVNQFAVKGYGGLLPLIWVLLISGCAQSYQPYQRSGNLPPVFNRPIDKSPRPAEVSQPAEVSNPRDVEIAMVTPRETYQTPVLRKKPSAPVEQLLKQALGAQSSGDYNSASGYIERALAIDNKSAIAWNRLALLRLEEGKLNDAENLAKKSNSYARGDRSLKLRNWRIISVAREQNGNDQGARAAREQARRLE